MSILHPCASPYKLSNFSNSKLFRQDRHRLPFLAVKIQIQTYSQPNTCLYTVKASRSQRVKNPNLQPQIDGASDESDYDVDSEEDEGGFASRNRFRGREGEKDYDRDPEFAEILGSCLDDPQKARSKVTQIIVLN